MSSPFFFIEIGSDCDFSFFSFSLVCQRSAPSAAAPPVVPSSSSGSAHSPCPQLRRRRCLRSVALPSDVVLGVRVRPLQSARSVQQRQGGWTASAAGSRDGPVGLAQRSSPLPQRTGAHPSGVTVAHCADVLFLFFSCFCSAFCSVEEKKMQRLLPRGKPAPWSHGECRGDGGGCGMGCQCGAVG